MGRRMTCLLFLHRVCRSTQRYSPHHTPHPPNYSPANHYRARSLDIWATKYVPLLTKQPNNKCVICSSSHAWKLPSFEVKLPGFEALSLGTEQKAKKGDFRFLCPQVSLRIVDRSTQLICIGISIGPKSGIPKSIHFSTCLQELLCLCQCFFLILVWIHEFLIA